MASNLGSSGYRVFMDAIEETRARGAFPGRKKQVGRPKKRIEDLEVHGLKLLEQLRKRLDRKLIEQGPDWVPDEDFVKALQVVTSQTTALARSLRAGRKAEQEARGNLTDDQLDAVFKTELARIATKLSEEEWRVLLAKGLGEDIAEACLEIFRTRQSSYTGARQPTQFSKGNPGGGGFVAARRERAAMDVADGEVVGLAGFIPDKEGGDA